MDNPLPLIVMGLLVVAMVVHAYSMGWDAGHSIHHSDEVHRDETPPPPEVPRLWK